MHVHTYILSAQMQRQRLTLAVWVTPGHLLVTLWFVTDLVFLTTSQTGTSGWFQAFLPINTTKQEQLAEGNRSDPTQRF